MTNTPVDHRRPGLRDPRDSRPHYVYRCYDADGALLYIGATEDVQSRIYHLTAMCNIGKHPNGQLIRRMARHTSQEYPDRASAFAAERAAIDAEDPELNIQSRRRTRVGSEDDR